MTGKSLFGINERLAGVLAYSLVFVSGFIFLIFDRENRFVKFHAMQSILFSLIVGAVLLIVDLLIGWIWIIGGIIVNILNLIAFVSWIYLMYSAYKGNELKIPIIGDVAKEFSNK